MSAAVKVKAPGMFGALSNSVKSTAGSVETLALTIDSVAKLGLVKAQAELQEALAESEIDYGKLKTNIESMMQASRTYK